MAWNQQAAGNWNNQWAQQQQAQQPAVRPAGVIAPANQWNQGAAQQKWQQPQQVRPPTATPAVETLVVSTGGQDMDEVVIRTLIGEYQVNGTNHGRKTYKKAVVAGAAADAVDVYLYYWDSRDGDAFDGWWFGNQLGGTQVWSHVKDASMTPPTSGWKIPWDGAPRSSMTVTAKAAAGPANMQAAINAAQQRMGGGAAMAGKLNASWMPQNAVMGKVRQIADELSAVEGEANVALEQAKGLAGDYQTVDGLSNAEQLLAPQVMALTMANKKLMENQKGASGDVAKEFAALGQKLRMTHASVNTELQQIRAKKMQAQRQEAQAHLEAKDMVLFQEIMPEAMTKTNTAEDAVEKAAITSEMITAGGDDMEEVKQAVDQTERAAREAQTAIGEARIFLNAKLASAKRFESDNVRGQATEELGKLQAQLQVAQTKLTPLKTARQDFVQRTAAQKMTNELKEKLNPAEVEVDKAEEANALLEGDEATKEQLHAAEVATNKAMDLINQAMAVIAQKKRSMPAQGVVREELSKLEERAQASLTKLQNMKNTQKEVVEKISSSTLTEEAADKLQAVQDAVGKVADAEGPFLMGLEELPLDETLTAVKACETAATSANTSVSIARMFIATKLVEVKRFTAASSKSAQEKLQAYQKQLEALTQKLTELKKNNAKRKKGALMRESEGCVKKAEELTATVAEVAAVFEDDSKLTELSSEDMRKAGEETSKAEKAANAALAEARKFITARQIEAKGKDSSEEVSALLIKYQTRLSTAQSEVSKYKKLSATVEQRLAAKKMVEDAVAKVEATEEKVKKACDLGAELNDSSPEGVGEKGYQEIVKNSEAAVGAATTSLKQVDRYLASQTRLTGPAKEEIAKLQPRVKEAQQKLDDSQALIKERTEKLLVEGMLAESEERVSTAEDSVHKAEVAEKPLDKVAELPAEEVTAAFAGLDAAAAAANSAIGGTKTFLAMKRLAAKRLSENSAKTTTEALGKLQVRLDEVTKKMQEIRKGMAERKAGQVKQEMEAKVVAVEKKVEEALGASKALEDIEASANFSAEKAKGECEKLSALDKDAQKLMDEALDFLVQRKKDVKSSEEETKALESRLTTAQSELAKSKKSLSEFEQRFVAQKLLSEANSMVADLESEVEKVKASCAPLLVEGGASFLASTTVSVISEALKAHLSKTNGTKEALFKEAGGESGKIAKEAFIAFMEKLPEKLGNEDLAFPEDQKDGIFEHVDADKDGEINFADFSAMFSIRYMCVQVISVTDGFEIAKSKTVVKLELDEVVEIVGESRELPNGVTRIECRTVETGKQGWVTMKGNQGTVYLELFSPYNSFMKATDRLIESVAKAAGKANGFVKAKTTALANTPKGPLADARAELTKLKPRVVAAAKEAEGLKTQVADSRKDYVRKQELVVEARDRKAAALLMKGIKDKVEVMDANAAKLFEMAKPLLSATGAELEAVETPLTISAEVAKAVAVLGQDSAAVRAAIAEQKEAVAKAPKGPMREAKQELAKYMVKSDAIDRKCSTTSESVRKACASIASSRFSQASAALRTEMQKREIDLEKYFSELSGGKDKIPEATFIASLKKLEGVAFPDEHLKLLADRIEADGIGLRSFGNMIQRFYQCVKAIAVTNEFAISKSKTVRMLELNETIEVVEGPTADPKLGIERVKGKAVTDGATGWISMKGNQGTPFLKEVPKPCYYCVGEVALDKEFRNANGDAPLKTLQAHEVIEVMEGPRKDSFEGAHRAKARASKDGAVGWFVMKTKEGVANAEQSGKYYICTAAIAMTDVSDIKACKVIRKLEQKEVAKVLEGPTEQEDSGVQRMRCKSLKDGQEGWITIKGNKGTVYAEECTKLYTLVNDVALHKEFQTDGATVVRQLAKGEAVEVTEGPKEEKFEVTRLKGRTVTDASVGWVTVRSGTVRPWSPHYKCVAEAELSSALKQGGEALRKVDVGEVVEVVDGPKKDGDVMRVRVRANKDSAVGWVSLKSAEGADLFKQHKVMEKK